MRLASNYRPGYAACLGACIGLSGAIWLWWPGAVTQIASSTYLPHGFCYLWNRQLLTLHVVSDSAIFLSYLAISGSLGWIVYRLKREIVLPWIFAAFGIFILSCGLIHAMDVVVLWKPLYWLQGDVKLLTAAASCITAAALPLLFPDIRRLIEEAKTSRVNGDRFLAISESSNDGFYLLDSVRDAEGEITDFQFTFVNEKGAQLISGTPESIEGQLLCVRLPENATNGLFEEYKNVVETSKRLDIVSPFEGDGINASWLHLQVMKLNDGIAVTAQNISQLKSGERKLAEASARFRFLVEGVRDHALFNIDTSGRITSWNRGAERLLGYAEADILGRNISCLLSAEDRHKDLTTKLLDEVLLHGRAEDEGWRVAADGTCFFANMNITAMLEGPGEDLGFAVVVRDMTERRAVAVAREEVRQERERLGEEFLSHVSHELRTPLTAAYFSISNVLDGLLGDLSPEQHEHLAMGFDNVNQIKDMVSDLLDITRAGAHKLAVVRQRVSAAILNAQAISTCNRNAEVAKVRLASRVAPDLPLAWADPVRVRQILINLIDNGIKFTPPGGTVTVGCAPWTEDKSFLCFSVNDTGCGIGPDHLESVFDRLVQVQNSIEVSRRGLGLGLFLARELTLMHGGQIWVESQLGEGSTFFFTLPVFSLAKLCAPILAASTVEAPAALITVRMSALEGTISADLVAEIREVLEQCIRDRQDVLLPLMSPREQDISFIVTRTPADGLATITHRIQETLDTFDSLGEMAPLVSASVLPLQPGCSEEQQIDRLAAEIEREVELHIQKRSRFHEREEDTHRG